MSGLFSCLGSSRGTEDGETRPARCLSLCWAGFHQLLQWSQPWSDRGSWQRVKSSLVVPREDVQGEQPLFQSCCLHHRIILGRIPGDSVSCLVQVVLMRLGQWGHGAVTKAVT